MAEDSPQPDPPSAKAPLASKDTSLAKLTPLEQVQRRLKDGQSVELISAKAGPEWSDWPIGLGKACACQVRPPSWVA